jgi:hypothetical protein
MIVTILRRKAGRGKFLKAEGGIRKAKIRVHLCPSVVEFAPHLSSSPQRGEEISVNGSVLTDFALFFRLPEFFRVIAARDEFADAFHNAREVVRRKAGRGNPNWLMVES